MLRVLMSVGYFFRQLQYQSMISKFRPPEGCFIQVKLYVIQWQPWKVWSIMQGCQHSAKKVQFALMKSDRNCGKSCHKSPNFRRLSLWYHWSLSSQTLIISLVMSEGTQIRVMQSSIEKPKGHLWVSCTYTLNFRDVDCN